MAVRHGAFAFVSFFAVAHAQASVINFNPYYVNDTSLSAPAGVSKLVYASQTGQLISMTSSNISVTGTTGQSLVDEPAFAQFTDMSLSPSGNYLYAADFGSESIGYGTPIGQSYVHQLDLSNGQWNAELSPIAYQIQTTGDKTFVLATSDQWITLTSNTWTNALGTSTQSSMSWSLYAGRIVYDPTSQRLIHGSEGISSDELTAHRVVDGKFLRQESSGTYGTAQGHGGSLVLSSDGNSLYYGNLQVDALDVAHNTLVLPETIYAANAKHAFGNGSYYDAKTGILLGKLGFNTTVYAVDKQGDGFWAYDGGAGLFRHFTTVPEPSSYALMGLGLVGIGLARRQQLNAKKG
jgi:PEP-CTERM motif